MTLYLVMVKKDKENILIKNFIQLCSTENVIIEISDSIIPNEEIDRIKKSDIAIVIISNTSVCSTWLLGLLEEMKNNFHGKYYYYKLDNCEITKSFTSYLEKMDEIKVLDNETIVGLKNALGGK